MVLCAQFPLIWYATWLLSVKDIVWTFDPTPWVKGVSVGKTFATMLLPASSALIWYATWLLSEKYIVWPFDPTPWVEGVSVGKIFATVLLPASSAVIWYATWPYSESLILASAPPPKSTHGGQNQALKLKSRLICFISIAALPTCKISAKILIIALVIAKFKYLTFDSLGGVNGGGVKLWHCHSYLQALGNHGL